MSRWLPSTEKWPKHQKPHWQSTLAIARENLWFYMPASDHSFGAISCQDAPASILDRSQRCVIAVYSTGTGGENAAMDAAKAIRKCPHKPPQPTEDEPGLARAELLVREARELVKGAKQLIKGGLSRQTALENLELAATQADQAEQDLLIEQAEALEDEGIAQMRKGEGLLARLIPEGGSALKALGMADRRLDDAKRLDREKQLRESIDEVRREIQTLRSQSTDW